jgi:alginate O-acetyltransferase complex protein AlgI
LHGLYITIFNLWTQLKQRYLKDNIFSNRAIANFLARLLTFLCVVFGWIFFRAETLQGAKNIISSMIGLNGISFSPRMEDVIWTSGDQLKNSIVVFDGMFTNGVLGNDPFSAIISIMFLIFFCYMMPNCIQIFSKYKPYILTYTSNETKSTLFTKILRWRPTPIWIFISSAAFVLAIINLLQESEFLYFQF